MPESTPLFSRSWKSESKREGSVKSRTSHWKTYESVEPSFARDVPEVPEQIWPSLRQLGECLDTESIHMLKTALVVQDLLEFRSGIANSLLEHEIDYTLTVIPLAKVFEREVDFSLVHWVRERLGIDLPTYFNKYQPEISAVFKPDLRRRRYVDFNRHKDGNWIPPALGESEISCRSLGRRIRPQGWSVTRWKLLMAGWHVIRVERNRAAHTEFIDKNSSMRVGSILNNLAGQKIFNSMCALKIKYRGF
jgi:hypothetical protein